MNLVREVYIVWVYCHVNEKTACMSYGWLIKKN